MVASVVLCGERTVAVPLNVLYSSSSESSNLTRKTEREREREGRKLGEDRVKRLGTGRWKREIGISSNPLHFARSLRFAIVAISSFVRNDATAVSLISPRLIPGTSFRLPRVQKASANTRRCTKARSVPRGGGENAAFPKKFARPR